MASWSTFIFLHRPIWSLSMNIWMIQRRTGWKCCGQMRPKSSSVASTQLTVFGGGGMLSMTPRTPSPPSNMEVETLCFGGVFLLRGQNNCTASKGRWNVPSGPGHWKWIVDGYFSMTQNTRPRQQRSGSRRSTLRSWSGLPSLLVANSKKRLTSVIATNGFAKYCHVLRRGHILISLIKLQINYIFLNALFFFYYSVTHCSNKPTITIIKWFLCQWANIQNHQGSNFFPPLCIYYIYIY